MGQRMPSLRFLRRQGTEARHGEVAQCGARHRQVGKARKEAPPPGEVKCGALGSSLSASRQPTHHTPASPSHTPHREIVKRIDMWGIDMLFVVSDGGEGGSTGYGPHTLTSQLACTALLSGRCSGFLHVADTHSCTLKRSLILF